MYNAFKSRRDLSWTKCQMAEEGFMKIVEESAKQLSTEEMTVEECSDIIECLELARKAMQEVIDDYKRDDKYYQESLQPKKNKEAK